MQDVRRIMLTTEELIAAFEGYRRITPDFLPNGKVILCVPTEDNTVKVTVKLNEQGAASKADFLFQATEAVKPLIRFCIENKIMLPRNGQKSLFVKDGVASLYVVLSVMINAAGYPEQLEAHERESQAAKAPQQT